MKEGVVLTAQGLEVLRVCALGKERLEYDEVESVELLPHHLGPLTPLFLRFRFSGRWVGTRLFHDVVAIRLKGRRFSKYLLCTPKNAPAFVEALQSRIPQTGKLNGTG